MANSTMSTKDRQTARTVQNGRNLTTSVEVSQHQKPLTEKRKQALLFVSLAQQLKTSGTRPESTKELGSLIGDWEEMISLFNIEGVDAVDSSLAILSTSNNDIAAALAVQSSTPAIEQQEKPEQEDKRFTQGKSHERIIKLASIEDIYAQPDPEYLITKIIEVATTSLLYGMSGTGKTFTALDLALSVAHGIYWHGRKVKQGTVWYINTEGARGLKKRLQAWHKEHPHLPIPQQFKVIPWSLDLREDYQVLLDTIEDEEEQQRPILIIFDNFSMCAPGINQNLQEEVSPILRRLNMLAQDYGCHVMMIHHTNKEGDFNGSMGYRNHVDYMIELRKEDKNDKNSAILFTSQKTRDDEPFRDIKTELKQVELYTDPNTLETITSCVVVESAEPIKEPGLKDTVQNVLDILGDDVLSNSEWLKACMTQLHIAKMTFERARQELCNKALVEKCRVDGKRFEQYRKVQPSTEEQQEESEDTHE